jgi:hypothetical protein
VIVCMSLNKQNIRQTWFAWGGEGGHGRGERKEGS